MGLDVLLSALMIISMLTHGVNSYSTQMIMTGGILNDTVFIANGFNMPVFGANPNVEMPPFHVRGTQNTMFPWLGDWISIPIGNGTLYLSPGDIVMFIGFLMGLSEHGVMQAGN